MSHRNREKRAHKRDAERSYSTIEQHTRQGNVLVPGMMTVPNVQLTSWRNKRLPEILWAAILISHMPRELALSIFRKVGLYGRTLRREGVQAPGDVTHSGMALLEPPERLRELLGIICADDSARVLLASLTLLEELPCSSVWFEFLQTEQRQADWRILARAVALTLDHQSQAATDCRWLKVIFLGLKGQIVFPAGNFDEELDELLNYPNVGDMRKVRPTIRSLEAAIAMTDQESDWSSRFWSQCLRNTPCKPLHSANEMTSMTSGTTVALVSATYRAAVAHANDTHATTGTDAKHDVVFGSVLFSLSILLELLRMSVGNSIIGRIGLRTILECYVTLAYLVKQNSPRLWESYRIYGAGQAKLALLKLAESQVRPDYVGVETLNALANEDMWQELLPIDLGHWDKANFRSLSERAELKDEYDRFYPWTSTYSHGHWGAMRDSVFEVCGNPLHRLHRIPRQSPRVLEDVISDACELIDRILGIADGCYPGFSARVALRRDSTNPVA